MLFQQLLEILCQAMAHVRNQICKVLAENSIDLSQEIPSGNFTANGVRVGLNIANITRNVEEFNMTGLLTIPDGRSIKSSYRDSTLSGVSVPAGSIYEPAVFEGMFFFNIDTGCRAGDYRFMLTGRETYLDITLNLQQ